ncbi:hypothetical protein [Pseudomonas sp. MH9.3]|uniref:hypothetical protein n=1 Tax=Pseudomonas sp. MH9.3 TaxID=3048630 RepID=UPI002AC9ACEC|nr:hypothetical protein [Pseudomonas sp. MH9.3]MEB0108405.1 hypothetical protein [Pseudomonas sp. MH9.3]WPX81388.1 hypothetical protein RHM60_09835 [Pseudomonas sp. MH9.3]WQG56963.1 hypothetical protein RHM66_16880 [Pseudomonas sp. RTB3]
MEPPEQLTKPDHLAEWNRLNIQNAENGLVSLIFENVIESTRFFDNYSTWLTVGTGAATALLLTNVGSILPFLTAAGFKLSGLFLVLSILFGVTSKFFAIQCQISDAQNESKTSRVQTALKHYFEEAGKIENAAEVEGRQMVTELNMERVFTTFLMPFPRWMRGFLLKKLIKSTSNPHVGYLIPLRFFRYQCTSTLLQVLFLFAGAVSAFLYAQAS